MKLAMFAIVFASLLLSACSKVADAPSEETLRRDLAGREFCYAYDKDARVQKKWIVKEGDVKEIVVRGGNSRDSGKAYEISAHVTISDGKLTIRGVLVFLYKRVENEWKLSLVSPRDGRPGKSFSFEVYVLDCR